MFHYGDKVVIRDGSKLDGSEGIVYGITDGQIQVLVDREVFWMVQEHQLERGGQGRATANPGDSGG